MDNVAEVEYRDIPGLAGYRAGSDGTIWSCWARGSALGSKGCGSISRIGTTYHKIRGRPHCKSGHIEIRLKGGKKHYKKFWKVHQLILWAFVGPCPDGMTDCRHLNGIPSDNRIVNLKWGTRQENIHDAIRHGTFRGGGMTVGNTVAFGESKSLSEWSKDVRCVVNYKTLFGRVRYIKMDPEKAITLGTKKGSVIQLSDGRSVD
jgi:hypothetical protein